MKNEKLPLNQYRHLLIDTVNDLKPFLTTLFQSVFREWVGAFTILPTGSSYQDSLSWNPNYKFEPFCCYVRDELAKADICRDCDHYWAPQAKNAGKPIDYWCVWGMRDVAVPIIVDDQWLGTIFCGQKRLEADADTEGEKILKNFANLQQFEGHLETLLEKRRQSSSVSMYQIEQIKNLLWVTAQFIAENVKKKIDYEKQKLNTKTVLNKFSEKFSRLAIISNVHTFWNDFQHILSELKNLSGYRSVVLLLTEKNTSSIIASHGISLNLESISQEHLITRLANPYGFPQEMCVERASEHPYCIICDQALDLDPPAHTVFFGKAQQGAERIYHFIIFFDSNVSCKNTLLVDQYKLIFSQFMHQTINIYSYLDNINKLKESIKDKERFIVDVAHQIKQPLHGILGDVQNLLADFFPEEKKKRIKKYLPDKIFHLSLLMKCVEYAAPRKQNIIAMESLLVKPYVLTAILELCIRIMLGYAEEQKVRILLDRATTDLIGQINVDSVKLQNAMSNVLYNTVKYSFPHTQSTVSAWQDQNRRELVINTTNFGIEIPRDKWENIFDRGFRAPQAMRYSQSGLGIGLYVSRELMKVMGGNARVVGSEATGRTYGNFEEFKNSIALTLPQKVIIKKEK